VEKSWGVNRGKVIYGYSRGGGGAGVETQTKQWGRKPPEVT